MKPKAELVAEPLEKRAPQQMADGPNEDETPSQREVTTLLQQRLEVALEVGRARARFALLVLGLQQPLQVLPRHRDGVVDRQQAVFGLVEHHAVDELRERGRRAHAGDGLLEVAAPAQARAPLEARIDPGVGELLDSRAVAEDVELDAGLLAAQLHRHEALLRFERSGRWRDGERKGQLIHRARPRKKTWVSIDMTRTSRSGRQLRSGDVCENKKRT